MPQNLKIFFINWFINVIEQLVKLDHGLDFKEIITLKKI